jgi:hypothetical protein
MRPWQATPGDLAGLPADMENVWIAVGGAGWRRYDPDVAAGPDPSQSPLSVALPLGGLPLEAGAAGSTATVMSLPARGRPPEASPQGRP